MNTKKLQLAKLKRSGRIHIGIYIYGYESRDVKRQSVV
jgi:hypothetical protein